jgi:hypothetical protein
MVGTHRFDASRTSRDAASSLLLVLALSGCAEGAPPPELHAVFNDGAAGAAGGPAEDSSLAPEGHDLVPSYELPDPERVQPAMRIP